MMTFFDSRRLRRRQRRCGNARAKELCSLSIGMQTPEAIARSEIERIGGKSGANGTLREQREAREEREREGRIENVRGKAPTRRSCLDFFFYLCRRRLSHSRFSSSLSLSLSLLPAFSPPLLFQTPLAHLAEIKKK